MDAGKLDRRVSFHKATGTPNGRGGTVTTWTKQFECAAHFRPLRNGESVMAGRLEGKQTVVITVRKSASTTDLITSDWRVTDNRFGTVYAVAGAPVLTDDRAHWEILCQSGVAP